MVHAINHHKSRSNTCFPSDNNNKKALVQTFWGQQQILDISFITSLIDIFRLRPPQKREKMQLL